MSRGKHLSLSEARKKGQLERFGKEQTAVGDRGRFDAVLKAMASGKKPPKMKAKPKPSR